MSKNADYIYRNVLSVQLKKNQKDKTPYTQIGVFFYTFLI